MNQSIAISKREPDVETLKKIIFKGDLSTLTPEEQIRYYVQRCERVGLDPYSKPFDFLEVKDRETGQVKVTLYANKEAAAQLTVNRGISIEKIDDSEENGVYKVKAHVRTADGRTGINLSVAHVKGLTGKNYENAIKRTVTQAIRRAILMACGLGDTDETEVLDIPNACPVAFPEERIMTDQEFLSISHRANGLDQWKCGRGYAMQIIDLSASLKRIGIDDDVIKSWLPSGITSRKDLTLDQAVDFIESLQARLKLMTLCADLAEKGVDKETMRMKLPDGAQSLIALTLPQVHQAIKDFQYWLDTYNEVIEGSVVNG